MDKVKCPSCGNNIGSDAKFCPHCGSQLMTCPECNSPVVKGYAICPVCGAPLKDFQTVQNANNKVNKNNESEQEQTDYYELWQKKNKRVKDDLNFLDILQIVFGVIVFVLIVIIAVIVFTQKPENGILGFQSAINLTRILVISASILIFIITVIEYFTNLYKEISCGNWMRKNNIDYVPYIKKAYANKDVSDNIDKDIYRQFCAAAFIAAHPQKAGQRKANAVIGFIFSVLSSGALACIALYYIYTHLIEVYTGIELELDTVIETLPDTFIIVCVAILVLQWAVKKIFDKSFDSQLNSWIRTLK